MNLHEEAKAYAAESAKYQLTTETAMRVAFTDGYTRAMQEVAKMDGDYDEEAMETARGGGNTGDIEAAAYEQGVHYVCETARTAITKATGH